MPMDPLDLEIGLAPIIYLAVGSAFFFLLLLIIESLQNSEKFMRKWQGEENNVEET
jgi:hypothetical protein